MIQLLSDEQWSEFQRYGFLRLDCVMKDGELEALSTRMDDIMLGNAPLDYDRISMQLDSDPERGGNPGPQSKGHKGATLAYRKVQELEFDPLFLTFLRKPLFKHICERAYGKGTTIACFRAMFMNKPAREGTHLVWHQDRWTDLDRDPQITIWTALDPATVENGCVNIIPGSHTRLINPEHGSGFLTQEQTDAVLRDGNPIDLEVGEGDTVLLHNWTLHSSGVNQTDVARRAFSVCYMDARTVSVKKKEFPIVFGEGALKPETS